MISVQIPAFGETDFFDNQESRTTRVVLIPNTQPVRFADYCALFEKAGFTQKEQLSAEHRQFAAYEKDGTGVFINYFAYTSELQLVTEENTAYVDFRCAPADSRVSPRLTQVKLADYGLSYVIRLSDGRLLVIDGGNTYDSDADALFARLKADAPGEKPVIAAWIMTHPHSDHFYCFFPFMQKYGEEVTVEKFMFHFPEHDDLEHYPKLTKDGVRFSQWMGQEGLIGGDAIRIFREEVRKLGVPVFTPHTGQTYRVADARLSFFATLDDTIHCSQNINATSMMFMMELGGQQVFFGADGSFGDARLPERYGQELKADILQIPHHGFGCGSDDAQIRGYQLIAPRVCLLPASKSEAYASFCTYKEGTNFLMTRQGIEEMITGEAERTLELPYEPDPAGVYQLQKRYLEGRDDCGARTWVFTGLNTARTEDFFFSVLNTTFINADLTVELYFEDMQKKIVRVKNKGLRRGLFRLNCLLTPEEDQAAFFAPDFLESKGIPANTEFAVRFVSSLPVVISNRYHAPAYRSSVV